MRTILNGLEGFLVNQVDRDKKIIKDVKHRENTKLKVKQMMN